MAVFPFTVRATDSEGSYSDRQFNITVRNSRVERFMIVDNNDAWTSPDGTTWTNRPQVGGYSCAYGNGFWLILSGAGATFSILKSADGINYASIPVANMTFLDDAGATMAANASHIGSLGPCRVSGTPTARLKFFAGKFWCPCWNNGLKTFEMWSTVDGVTWQKTTLFKSNASNAVTPHNSNLPFQYTEDLGTMFIPMNITSSAFGISGNSFGYGWSFDGTTWTQIKNINQDPTLASNSVTATYSLARVNGMYFVGVLAYNGNTGQATGTYHYSTDAINWTVRNYSSDMTAAWTAATPYRYPSNMFYANGTLYLMSGYYMYNNTTPPNYVYYTSTDGLNWTTSTPMKNFSNGGNNPVYASAYGVFRNGVFIITNLNSFGTDNSTSLNVPNGGFRISLDGVNWTTVNSLGSFKNFNDIAAMS